METYWIRRVLILTLALTLIAAGFFIGTTVVSTRAGATFHANVSELAADTAQVSAPSLDIENILSDVYTRVSPSVVSINVVSRLQANNGFPDELAAGTGTGFVIDTQGHIITNNHVVMGATRIEVNFFDGTIARGEVVGLDPDSDLAVIRVDLPQDQLHPVTFADSNSLFIGQSVVALGSPFGQRWTMTTGIVSAKDRTIQGLTNYQIGAVIQTDAAINPGNSGGPLLNLQGEVVGVNSQILSRSNSSSGVGFAIPSNLVQRVADSIINQGEVNYSYLGISSRPNDVDLALIEAMNLPNDTRGVVVQSVDQAGPAGQGGLRNASNFVTIDGINVPRSADIITAIDNTPVTSFSSLIGYLASNTQPGQTVNLTVMRDGTSFVTLPVVLGARPENQ